MAWGARNLISTQVDWTRKDFRSFLNAMERRGRDEVDVIARETSNETGKTEEEVRRYHTVFWARHKGWRTGNASSIK